MPRRRPAVARRRRRRTRSFLGTDTLEGSGSGHQVYVSNDGGQTLQPQRRPGQRLAGRRRLLDGVREALLRPQDARRRRARDLRPRRRQLRRRHQHAASSAAELHAARGLSRHLDVRALAGDRARRGRHRLRRLGHEHAQAGTSGGCSGAETPAPNPILMISTKDLGKTWSKPYARRAPSNARVFWPWIAAGDAGKVSVVWYQTEPQDGIARPRLPDRRTSTRCEAVADRCEHGQAAGHDRRRSRARRSTSAGSARAARPASRPARTAGSATTSRTRSTRAAAC